MLAECYFRIRIKQKKKQNDTEKKQRFLCFQLDRGTAVSKIQNVYINKSKTESVNEII